MISLEELQTLREKRKTNLYYVEKEYLQYLFLYGLSKYPNHFIFKGGTCLRICFNLERASEDIDVNTDLSPKELKKIMPFLLKNFEAVNIEYEIIAEKEYEGNIRFEIRCKGPLYKGTSQTTNTLKIDFTKRKVQHTVAKVIPSFFSDIPSFTILILQEQEILAEKIRALLMRKEARDLYDIWFLINKNIKVDKALVMKKLKEDNIPFAQPFYLSKNIYERDLKYLVRTLPKYEQVIEEVSKALQILEA